MNHSLQSIVEQLAGKTNRQRRIIIRDYLHSLEVPFHEQEFCLGHHANVLVDLAGENQQSKRLLLSAHYDAVPGSPGANDDASAVAVLLGVVEEFRNVPSPFPLRIAFFDAEESGLKGSREYVKQYGTKDLTAVLNLEMVGRGSLPVYWPVARQTSEYQRILLHAAEMPSLINYHHGHSGDHQSFQEAGMRDSVSLTLIDERDRPLLKEIRERLAQPNQVNLLEMQQKINDSYTFRNYHQPTDTADQIEEESLQIAKNLVLKVIDGFAERYDQQPVALTSL